MRARGRSRTSIRLRSDSARSSRCCAQLDRLDNSHRPLPGRLECAGDLKLDDLALDPGRDDVSGGSRIVVRVIVRRAALDQRSIDQQQCESAHRRANRNFRAEQTEFHQGVTSRAPMLVCRPNCFSQALLASLSAVERGRASSPLGGRPNLPRDGNKKVAPNDATALLTMPPPSAQRRRLRQVARLPSVRSLP